MNVNTLTLMFPASLASRESGYILLYTDTMGTTQKQTNVRHSFIHMFPQMYSCCPCNMERWGKLTLSQVQRKWTTSTCIFPEHFATWLQLAGMVILNEPEGWKMQSQHIDSISEPFRVHCCVLAHTVAWKPASETWTARDITFSTTAASSTHTGLIAD